MLDNQKSFECNILRAGFKVSMSYMYVPRDQKRDLRGEGQTL